MTRSPFLEFHYVQGPYRRPGLLSRVMRWLGGWVGVS